MTSTGNSSSSQDFRYIRNGTLIAIALIIAVVYGGKWLIGCLAAEGEKPKSAENIRLEFRTEVEAVLRMNLKSSLKDPESARISDVVLYRDRLGDDDLAGHYSLCGQINAKNGFGGYTGDVGFVSSAWFKKSTDEGGPLQAGPSITMDDAVDTDASRTYTAVAAVMCKDATSSK
jgi:hypothetical protein